MIMKKSIIILIAVLVLSVAGMTVALVLTGEANDTYGEFVKPEFEKTAIKSLPTDAGDNWQPFFSNDVNFSAHLCVKPIANKKSLEVYFYNDESNEIWLKIRIYETEKDENGNVLYGDMIGESGLLKPGEYVKDISLNKRMGKGDSIAMKIMGYQPETYYSEGTVALFSEIG